jgi:HK97 family phage major capsid protein
MWLAAANGDEKAFRWCQNQDMEVRAMSEGVNTKGGVLVPDELSQRIIDNRESYGVMRQNAYIEPMGSDVKNISRQTGGNTAYFVGEGADLTESDAAYDNVKLVAKKLAVSTRISSELEEDADIDVRRHLRYRRQILGEYGVRWRVSGWCIY